MTKILLAEDHPFSRDLLMRRLQNKGFEVETAANGREAVAAARSGHPDLILMDLDMPVMDGRAAIRTLRNDPRTFRIPIIVVSGNASTEDVAEVFAAGCQAFDAKPTVLRRLVERIEEVLGAAVVTPGPSAPEELADPAPDP
jgi:two-component system, cell cycle response regulator DivK